MADEKMTPDPVEQVREEMEYTRASLSKKFDTLESKVAESVGDATASISAAKETVEETVQAVRGTVSATKESIEETVHTVQEALRGTVSAVGDFLDVSSQVQKHPWAALAGSVVIGYKSRV